MRIALGKGIGVPWLQTQRWTPASEPGIILWLEGDLDVAYTPAFSAAWGDQSGNDNHFTEGAGVPFYAANSWTGM